jgi:glycosyltransferase involved in cell wall biosynthesis
MKVAFDISILGAEERSPQNRTGIYKAVEALFKQLISLKKQGLVADLELMAFSSDLRHLEGSRTVWARLLAETGLSVDEMPFFGHDLLTPIQKRVLQLSEQKMTKKSQKKPYRWESFLLLFVKQIFRKHLKLFSAQVASHLPQGTVVHIPFTRDLEKFLPISGLIRIVTCYDLTPIVCEAHALAKPKEKTKCEAMFNLISPEDFLCCVSESARTDLLAFRPDLNPEQLIVTYLGAEVGQFVPIANAERLQQIRVNYGIPRTASYLLSVSTHLPHKNIPFLIRNFLELCDKQAIADDVVLVLCGGKRKFTDDMEALLLQYPQYQHRVIVTGYVVDADLPALYSGATGFVLPSLYEGFGLPVLEAMQCGTPVLCSNTASLPEVGGDAALYASPTNDAEFQAQLITLLNNPELRQQMVEKGFKQAEKFSWKQSAQETVAVYRQAYSAGISNP